MARKYGVRYTPTFQFFPESATGLGKTPREREVARSVGYVQPPQFLATFRYVAERYEKGSLDDYLKRALIRVAVPRHFICSSPKRGPDHPSGSVALRGNER